MQRPDMPSAPVDVASAQTLPRRGPDRWTIILGVFLAIALIGGAIAAFGWISSQDQLKNQRIATSQAVAETARARAEAEDQLANAEDETAQIQSERDAFANRVVTLRSEIRRLRRSVTVLGGSAQAYSSISTCLDAILATYNSITFQNEWYAAYTNVTQGPQCSSVINTTSGD